MKSYLIFSFYFSLQISKLETDIQRLNQSIEKQKNSEMQLRTQLSDMKNVRKELEDLRAENSALQTKYVRFNL
jgi:chaperonin cofactor prefoldin